MLILALICFLAAAIAVALHEIAARWLPGWLALIIMLTVLLLLYTWLPKAL